MSTVFLIAPAGYTTSDTLIARNAGDGNAGKESEIHVLTMARPFILLNRQRVLLPRLAMES